jgi:hypothetical protein
VFFWYGAGKRQSEGEVFGEKKIFYSAEAAEKAGREWISAGS